VCFLYTDLIWKVRELLSAPLRDGWLWFRC
jgi:hypothetical protein